MQFDRRQLLVGRAAAGAVRPRLPTPTPTPGCAGPRLFDGRWRVLDRVRLGAPLPPVGWRACTVAFPFFGNGDTWTAGAHAPRWRVLPLACTSLLPVWRPPAQLVARSRLTLAGSYLDGRVSLRSWIRGGRT